MDRTSVIRLLDDMWAAACKTDITGTDPEIDRFMQSKTMSMRYALLTQVLGKIEDGKRDTLAMQAGADGAGSASGLKGWDARRFSKDVVVPWVTKTRNIIGRSDDPYVNNPLRRSRLDDYSNIRDVNTWRSLAEFLARLNNVGQDDLTDVLRRSLESVYRLGTKEIVNYDIPERVSLDGLCDMVNALIEESSGGYRPHAICAAFMKTVRDRFGIFDDVRVQEINAPDSQSESPGDIVCSMNGAELLVVEVKDRKLKIEDLQKGAEKIAGSGIRNLLFTSSGIRDEDRRSARSYGEKRLREADTSIYHADLVSLIRNVFVLLDLDARLEFIKKVRDEFECSGRYEDRLRWAEMCISQ